MALSDFIHSLFVLLTTLSYLLPAYEGFQRKSLFYTLLFLVLVCLSFLLHGEDLSLWAPLEPKLDARVHNISDSLAYFLLSCMLLVVFEIRNERLGRVVAGAWATLVWLTDPSALARNVAISGVLGVFVLIVDVATYKRRFTPAYWRRLGLITLMAVVGAVIFRLLKVLWVWHGIWHLYMASTCYLLLLAQRTKQRLSGKASRDVAALGTSSNIAGLTTPIKRRAGGGGGAAVEGAAAVAIDANGIASAHNNNGLFGDNHHGHSHEHGGHSHQHDHHHHQDEGPIPV